MRFCYLDRRAASTSATKPGTSPLCEAKLNASVISNLSPAPLSCPIKLISEYHSNGEGLTLASIILLVSGSKTRVRATWRFDDSGARSYSSFSS